MKLIRFGFLLVFLAFLKRISSLGKKIRVKISQEKPLAFEAESEFQNTKFLELKKTERSRYTAKAKAELENEKNIEEKNKEKEKEEKKAAMNFNLDIGILNRRCNDKGENKVAAKPSLNIRNAEKKIKEKSKEEEETFQKPKITPAEQKEKEKKDLGFSKETEKEFLKGEEETKSSSAIINTKSEIKTIPNKAPRETSNPLTPVPTKTLSEQTNKQNENFLAPSPTQTPASAPTPSNTQIQSPENKTLNTQNQAIQQVNSASAKPEANVQLTSSASTPAISSVSPIAIAQQTTPNPLSRYTNIVFGLNGPMSFDKLGLAYADDGSHFDKLQDVGKSPLNQAAWPTRSSSFLSDIAL
jgi:hypothetical protein